MITANQSQEPLKLEICFLTLSKLSHVSSIPRDILQKYDCEQLVIQPLQQFEDLKEQNKKNVKTICKDIENNFDRSIQKILTFQRDINYYFDEIQKSSNEYKKITLLADIQEELKLINNQVEKQQTEIDQLFTNQNNYVVYYSKQINIVETSLQNFLSNLEASCMNLSNMREQNSKNLLEIEAKKQETQNYSKDLTRQAILSSIQKKEIVQEKDQTYSTLRDLSRQQNETSSVTRKNEYEIKQLNQDLFKLLNKKDQKNQEIQSFERDANNILTQINKIHEEISPLDQEKEKLQNEIKSLTQKSEIIEQKKEETSKFFYNSILDFFKKKSSENKQNNDNNNNNNTKRIKEIQMRIQQIDDELEILKNHLSAQHERVNKKYEQIDQCYDVINQNQQQIQNQHNNIKNKESEIYNNRIKTNGLDSNISNLKEQIQNQNDKYNNKISEQTNFLNKQILLEQQKAQIAKEENQILSENSNISKLNKNLSNNIILFKQLLQKYIFTNQISVDENEYQQFKVAYSTFNQYFIRIQNDFNCKSNQQILEKHLQQLIDCINIEKDSFRKFKNEVETLQKTN